MPDQNPIYDFMKSNKLTDLDEKTFINKYSAPDKAKEIYSFMAENKLTDLDESKFYDKYLKKKVGGAESFLTELSSKGFSPEQISLLQTGAKPPKPVGKTGGATIIPTNITPDQKAYERELKRQDAAINTLKNTYSQKGLKFDEKSKRGQEQVLGLLEKEKNNDLTLVTGKDQKPYLVRGEGFLESAGKGILRSITEPIESTKINFTNDPNELADLLDEKIKEEPNVPESAPTKFGGYLGGLAGGLPKMMALLAIPVAGESAMVGEMYHNALANQRRALYEKGLQEGMNRTMAAQNAMKNAPITAIPDAIVGAAMARGIGGKAAGAEIIPNAAKESFLKATGNGLKGVAKVSGIGGAAEYGRSKAEQELGYNVTDAEAIENGLRGMGEYAIMDAAFKLAHAGPKYLSSAAKNLLSTVPKEVLEVAAEKYPDGKRTLEDVAKFSETKAKVQDFVPEEKVGAVTGLTEKTDNLKSDIKILEEKKKEVPAAVASQIDAEIADKNKEVKFYDNQIKKVIESKDVTGIEEEIDDITGLKASEKPIVQEEAIVKEEVKPTEDIKKTLYGTISGSIPLSEALPNGVYIDLGNGLFAYADKNEKISAIVDRNNNHSVSKSFWNEKEGKWKLPNKANLEDDAKRLGINENDYINKYQDAVDILNNKTAEVKPTEVDLTTAEKMNASQNRYGILKDGADAGFIVTTNPENNVVKIKGVTVNEELRGKNIAGNAYIKLGESLAKDGVSLESDSFDKMEPSANRVWEKLVDKGLAIKGENNYQFKPTEEKYFNLRHRNESFDDNASVSTYLSQDRAWDSSMKDYIGEKTIIYTLPSNGKIMFKELQNNTNTFKVSAEAKSDKPTDIKNAFKRIEKYLPLNHKLAEKVSISVDGLRIWDNFIKTGKYIKTGETNEVELTPIDKANIFKDLKYTTETKWSGAKFEDKNKNEALERVKKYIKDNNLDFKVKLDGNAIKVEVPVLKYNPTEEVKPTEVKETIKTKENAIQEPSASSVLQYPQEGVGETRGERKRVEPSIKGEKVTKEGKQAPGYEKEEIKVYNAKDLKVNPKVLEEDANYYTSTYPKSFASLFTDMFSLKNNGFENAKIGDVINIFKKDYVVVGFIENKKNPDKTSVKLIRVDKDGNLLREQDLKKESKKTYQEALKEKQEAEKKQTRQVAGEKAAASRRIFEKVYKMDAPEDAEQIALRYLADGGKVSKEAVDEAYGSVKRAQLNVKRRELLSEEVKSKDFVSGKETLNDVAHRLWEENGQRISERDIKKALMTEIGNNNTRLEAAEAYLDKYSAEYQLEKEEMRLAEQYKEQYLEEQAKLEEELRKPLDEQIEGEASEEHINNLIEQYEAEIKGEDKQLRSEGEGKVSAEAGKGEVVKETPKGEEKLAQEYKEVIKKASKKAKENAKKDFVDRNFDKIVEKLKIQIKCPT